TEILFQEFEALDGFILRQVCVDAFHFFADQAGYPGIVSQFPRRSELAALFSRVSGHGDKIGNKKRRDEFLSVPNDYRTLNIGAHLELIFNGLGRDEFSTGSLDHLLFAVRDHQVAIRVEVADVTSSEPSV